MVSLYGVPEDVVLHILLFCDVAEILTLEQVQPFTGTYHFEEIDR